MFNILYRVEQIISPVVCSLEEAGEIICCPRETLWIRLILQEQNICSKNDKHNKWRILEIQKNDIVGIAFKLTGSPNFIFMPYALLTKKHALSICIAPIFTFWQYIVCGYIVSFYTPVLINKPPFKPYLPLTDYTVIQAQRKLVSTEY